jgi:hypothetical protein
MNQKIATTKKAAHSVMRAGGEHYHFNMACHEFGEPQVLDAMRDDIYGHGKLSFEDAAFQAAAEFRLMKQLESGQHRFKNIRQSLCGNKEETVLSQPWPQRSTT